MKRLVLTIISLVLILTSVNAQSSSELLDNATMYIKLKDYKAVHSTYKLLLKLYPDAAYLLAVGCTSKTDCEEIIETADNLLLIDSQFIFAKYLKGAAAYNYKDWKSGIENLEMVIRAGVTNYNVFFKCGFCRAQLNDYKKAIEDYNKAIMLDVSDPAAYYTRGIARYETSDFYGAMYDFNIVLSKDPGHAWALYRRGLCKFEIGKRDEDCDDLKNAQKLGVQEAGLTLERICK